MSQGLISHDQEKAIRDEARNEVRDALKAATVLPKSEIDVLFDDVYENVPQHLEDQKAELKAHLRKYGAEYGLENWKDGKAWPTS